MKDLTTFNSRLAPLLKATQAIWLLGLLFLYFLVLPVNSLHRTSTPYLLAINKNCEAILTYYLAHQAMPPELTQYAENAEDADIILDKRNQTGLLKRDGREIAVSCPVHLGMGDWIWVAKSTPLLFFTENAERDGQIIMMFFDPQLEQQYALVKSNGVFTIDHVATEIAEKFLHKQGISPYRVQIHHPRWLGMVLNALVSVVTLLLFMPLGKMPPAQRGRRAIIIGGAVIPLLLMLFCVDTARGFPMVYLGIAVLVCGVAEVFRKAHQGIAQK